MNLHPVVVLISVTVGSALFGLVGAFLAVPVVAVFAVCWRYVLEILKLQSGEIQAEDIRFETVAGELIGRYTEDEGRLKRVALRDNEFANEAAGRDAAADGTDPTTMDVDAAPHPAERPRIRPQLDKARDILDKTFDKFRRS